MFQGPTGIVAFCVDAVSAPNPERPWGGGDAERENVVSCTGDLNKRCWPLKICFAAKWLHHTSLNFWLPFLEVLYIRWPPALIPTESLQSAYACEIKRNSVVNSKEQSTPGKKKKTNHSQGCEECLGYIWQRNGRLCVQIGRANFLLKATGWSPGRHTFLSARRATDSGINEFPLVPMMEAIRKETALPIA